MVLLLLLLLLSSLLLLLLLFINVKGRCPIVPSSSSPLITADPTFTLSHALHALLPGSPTFGDGHPLEPRPAWLEDRRAGPMAADR